ncbi:16785_t:CDS:2 [Cetraspora pellucida]|uniref:16785_t:CDS:1 n=1 Tax=Cetraspora pellucida TaxID=1433469 RepID=A0A9N9GE96_9GLOM|nr:16785_t:CDS:2 [Cetraspora pellucida]
MAEKDFMALKAHFHDAYVTSKPMKEWHNIDFYVCKLLENNPELSKNDCFAVCCQSLGSLSNQRKHNNEKIVANNAEIQQKKTIQHQQTTVSAINLVTKEIDELASHKHQREPSNRMLFRETKKICYIESSNLDLENVEESKKSIKNKNVRLQQYVCNNFISCKTILCSTVHSATSTSFVTSNIIYLATSILIMTSNKPIITKATYNEYSAYIICAFNTMIHLVKETVEKLVYEKVRNMLQMGNKLVMNDLIIKKLKNIFQASYSEIKSKIILEMNIEDNQTMKESRFIFFIQYALLDFVFMFRYLMPKVLDHDMLK